MTKFERAIMPPREEWKLREMARAFGTTLRHVLAIVKDEDNRTIGVFINDLYQVNIQACDTPRGFGKMVHLSIKRRDKQPIHDWRHLQQIKNELVGPENEGVELYPKESRLADSANQYHLWVFKDTKYGFPFGFGERFVNGESVGGAVQRPFNEQ